MAHVEQQDFCKKMKVLYPKYFSEKRILDIGSLDVNGNNRFLFDDQSSYIGLDVGEGPNVDVSIPGHMYDAPDEFFDIIISTEVFEHDMHYVETIKNIIRMLKPGGAFIFTCASGQRPEHGTRRRGESNAPLLIQQSEEWADYYKNLEKFHFLEIPKFKEAFPDGIFEFGSHGMYNHEWSDPMMHNIHSDIYFFGVKGGIKNDMRYSIDVTKKITLAGEYPDDIFVVDTWPNSPEKEADLIECIKRLREFEGIPILLVSHYAIKPEIQKLVDYYLYDKSNPILLNKDFDSVGVASGRWTKLKEYRVDTYMEYHHDYAIWTSMTNAFNFCKYLGKKMIHFMEYDCIVDTFQYKQTFLEQAHFHDAVIYEYRKGSTVDPHFVDSPFMATYLFSIRTDVAVNVMSNIKSITEYFANRPTGWQLERLFLKYLRQTTPNIAVSEYIANSNELNTQAVWNRDGILRNDAKFQIYPCADSDGNFYVHLISGFHEEPASSDYLLEIKYDGLVKFITLPVGAFELVSLGKYAKGKTVKVNYLGVEAYSEFLHTDLSEFLKMNVVTRPKTDHEVEVLYNFVDGAYAELRSQTDDLYRVKFIDADTGVDHYSVNLKPGHWAKSSIRYFKNWRIEIRDQFDRLIESAKYDATGQRVYVAIESKALGDTFAWMPYADEFRKKHNCHLICSTFHNYLFRSEYPEIEFVEPGVPVNNIYAMYRVGWFMNDQGFDLNGNPNDFKLAPLQKTSSDILGLEYVELKPKISLPTSRKLTKKVGLGIHSTAQAKYWNNPTGWQEVTDWLIENGYEPVILSKEEDGYMGNRNPVGAIQLVPGPLDSVISEMLECQAFIGISSGLTWLAWVIGTPAIQISGFTEPFNEPNSGIVKIAAPTGACSGCANRLRFDPGDWNWCPDQKGTDRQFECSRLITADRVIAELKKILV